MPEQAAYDAAKAVDQHRAALRWFIRPYSYDPHGAWKNHDVPLHPGAERYYREMGYMEDTPRASADAGDADACGDAGAEESAGKESGCSVGVARGSSFGAAALTLLLGLALARRRARAGGRRLERRTCAAL